MNAGCRLAAVLSCSALALSAGRADEAREVPLPLADKLFAGALAGAGLDEATPAEIIRPTTRARIIAALRTQGGVLQDGKTSLVLQLSPFYLTLPRDALYLRLAEQRRSLLWRLYQDTAVTLVATPGTPGTAAAQQRFFTVGAGASVELLGNRSVYSPRFAGCIRTAPDSTDPAAVAERAAVLALPPARPPPARPARRVGEDRPEAAAESPPPRPQRAQGEPDDRYGERLLRWEALTRDYRGRHRESDEEYGQRLVAWEALVQQAREADAAREAALASLVAGIDRRIRACAEAQDDLTSAVYLSGGGRWTIPSLGREPGDPVFVQREYLAGTYELRTPGGLSLALQLRWLGDRPGPEAFQRVLDVGAGLAFIGEGLRWSLDLTQTALTASGAPGKGSATASLRARLVGEVAVLLGVRGEGRDLGRAFDTATFTVSIAYEDKPIVTHSYQATPE